MLNKLLFNGLEHFICIPICIMAPSMTPFFMGLPDHSSLTFSRQVSKSYVDDHLPLVLKVMCVKFCRTQNKTVDLREFQTNK